MVLHRRLFLLLLALLPTQLGWHFWPRWASILGRKIDYLSPTVFLTDLILIGMLATWVAPVLIRTRNVFMSGKSMRMLLGILSVTVLIAINIWGAVSPAVAIYKWIKVVEFVGLGFYILRTRPALRWVVGALSIGALYSSLLAVVQFALQHSVGGVFRWLGERTFASDTPGIAQFHVCSSFLSACTLVLRPYATFPHPNVLGGFLATTLPLMGFLFFTDATQKRRGITTLYFGLVIILGGIALVLTFSRSAWIMTAVGLLALSVVYVVSGSQRNRRKLSLIIAPAVIVSIFILLGVLFQPSVTDESVVRRVELNNAALRMWQRSPFVGFGLGNFLVALPEYDVSRQINFLQPAHNIYLLVLSEVGLIGFLICMILVWHGFGAFTLLRQDKKVAMNNPGIIRIIPFGCLLLIGFVDHYPITLQQGQLLFVLLYAIVLQSKNR